MSSEATSGTNGREEKTSITDIGTLLARKVGRVLGEDDQGREHVVFPAKGEIQVRDRENGQVETVDRIDLGAKDRHDYRVFVAQHVDDVTVDWNEEVF